ncbi:MAG: Hsp20/alpha crystallin family protein [Spirochaetota bacterium]
MRYVVRSRRDGNRGVDTDFDRVLKDVFGNTAGWSTARPAVDVIEEDERYLLEAELPGMTEKDVDVRVEDNLLTITARRTESTDEGTATEGASEENRRYLMRERGNPEYRRSFVLPKDADRSNIEARFTNGILSLEVKKLPEAKPRQINIQSGE